MKRYNVDSVVSVRLNRHDCKRDLVLSIKRTLQSISLAYKMYIKDRINYKISFIQSFIYVLYANEMLCLYKFY